MNKLANPFVTSGHIEIDGPFVGRDDDLDYLVFHMTSAQPTSVNVIGDKNIGKSCLLYRFSKVWKNLVAEHDKYVVIYLSFSDERETHENRFYQHVAEEKFIRKNKI